MSQSKFSHDELAQYSRHLILPEFNIEGQRRLKNASVLVLGAGGLGCPVLQYLTAAGVGHIGIVDHDVIDQSNLQRQVLYAHDDIGKSKAGTAAIKLSRINPHVRFSVIDEKLTSQNALEIIRPFDVVCDGTDNFPTRYLINDACVILGKPNIYGAIFRFEGQVSVFNYLNDGGHRGPQYRDIFPAPPPPGLIPDCAEGGVLGVLPGIVGSMQASEIIKLITGIGAPLAGRLFIFDALSFETRTLKISKNPELIVPKELIDYEDFCRLKDATTKLFEEISVEELKEMRCKNESFELIDVREPYEYEIANLGGRLIPLRELESRLDEISSAKKLILMCRSGTRSAKAVEKLKTLGFRNIYNLKGGILEWAQKIDTSLPRY
jgi:molybdopterin/thiamine biosynthesis adenylyltransferase/rhodanese-related sulfurtransferase